MLFGPGRKEICEVRNGSVERERRRYRNDERAMRNELIKFIRRDRAREVIRSRETLLLEKRGGKKRKA